MIKRILALFIALIGYAGIVIFGIIFMIFELMSYLFSRIADGFYEIVMDISAYCNYYSDVFLKGSAECEE